RAGRLRRAFVGSLGDRRAALAEIWESDGAGDRYGALIESALAAGRLPPSAGSIGIAPDLVAACLAAGDVTAARRWWPVAARADAATRTKVWGLLAVGDDRLVVTPEGFADWRSGSGADTRRARLLLAGLAGLGVANGAGWDDLRRELLPRGATSWTRAIDIAAAGGRSGEVALLAATGLQGDWRAVPPLHLYHIIAALTRVGRSDEARLLAAEALTRG
ncbi:hypothetical protein IP88_07535, partial [alpha proteobacterium AAP81b]